MNRSTQEVMVSDKELTELEDEGWRALSSPDPAARQFYDSVLDDKVVMLLPDGMVLEGRATVLDAMSGQPWESYVLRDLRAFRPTPDTGVVTYAAEARRDGAGAYSALMSSVYVRRDDGWKLTFHQQTPL